MPPETINKIIGTARIMFGYSFTMGELETNPVRAREGVERDAAGARHYLHGGAGEVCSGRRLAKFWKGELRHYTLNLIAASTGLRLGECQALRVQDIDPEGFVRVAHSWDDRHGMNAPKWNSTRIVPLPSRTAEAIENLLALHRWGDPQPYDVLFWGVDRVHPDKDLDPETVQGCARSDRHHGGEASRAKPRLSPLGGTDSIATSEGRCRTSSSARNGYRSEAMTDRYDHVRLESLRDVLAVQDKLFTFEKASAAAVGVVK